MEIQHTHQKRRIVSRFYEPGGGWRGVCRPLTMLDGMARYSGFIIFEWFWFGVRTEPHIPGEIDFAYRWGVRRIN